MGILTKETIKLIAREMYDYELSEHAAGSIAHGAGALMTMSMRLGAAFDLGGIEPPFGYPSLVAEAERIRDKKAR